MAPARPPTTLGSEPLAGVRARVLEPLDLTAARVAAMRTYVRFGTEAVET